METVPPSAPAQQKPSLFSTVVASTPVLLAVIATLILGQSSSEMTKAQYQRSLASQNQSQVANQWDFFQSKRNRGSLYEATAVVLSAQKADPFNKDDPLDFAEFMLREIQSTLKETPKLRDRLRALEQEADDALKRVTKVLNPPKEGAVIDGEKLTPENVKAALDALEDYPKATPEKSDRDGEIDKEQNELLAAIRDDVRKLIKPEKEIAPLTLTLKTETLDKAMERAKAKAAEVSRRGKSMDGILAKIDALVYQNVQLARKYERIVAPYLVALDKVKDADQVAKLEEHIHHVRRDSAQLIANYKAARYAFDARRYEDDARGNQDVAYLYAIQALQSSARSDRHLSRSFGFMIAMLVAQAGVTIGTLALALRWRLPTWLIAVIAGLSAIALGVYVFLELGPLSL